ncbi:polysaccharide biosynthesis protein [Thiocapsa marina]|uniref:Polysaccharide biosynthesis protein CapD n=1 Tax=Thiocapsa marina 5811 TaxID=768671 RepID=F9UCA9_9GAMM|nr:nucleoside-diphosphate sugar epimerase/dehydratase [Thiocapsa marina]EGV18022.1 polysaccharide biosynthesis protein CapD [Thiocapsa marina 5811]
MNPLLDRLRSRTAAFSHDLLMIPVAWLAAYWLRFNLGRIPPEFVDSAFNSLPWVLVIQGTVFWMFGLYRGVWRFASLPDLVRIVKAAVAGTVLVVVTLFILNRTELIPRSVPVLFLGLQVILLAGPRLLYRWMKDHRLNLSSGQRVLIVGAGRAGEMLVRDMLRDASRSYFPVGFVDDKPRRQGGEVHGVPVIGRTAAIPELVAREDIDLLMLAVPSATAKEMRRLVELCEGTGRPFRTVPELRNLMTGQVSISQLRPVSIEDLLGRDPVSLDWEGIRAGLSARAVLVTGAGGSIGSELVRQIAAALPSRLILVDNGEYNLYRIEMELVERYPSLCFTRYLLDVADAAGLDAVFAAERPQIIFHAAAYKHVPMLEDQIRAAVRNNVVGTRVVAEAASRWACERFVLISTDKAVHPANVMGATKRVAEAICQALDQESACRYITVRFGNVLGSAGSVVPLFSRQIEHGGPVTVTHPDIERFFMTIPEACQLIMQAAVIGDGGEIFVLDMGEPVKIRYLAEQMIRLSGREPGEEISIHYIGLRPGEKLYEELFYDSEDLVATRHPKIRVAKGNGGLIAAAPEQGVAALEQAAAADEHAAMVSILRAMLPEWHPEPRVETLSTEAVQDRRNADA